VSLYLSSAHNSDKQLDTLSFAGVCSVLTSEV